MRSASTPTVRGTAVSRGSPRPIASARRASARWRAAAFWASFERVASSAATSGAPRAASASFCHSPTYHASWRRPFPSTLRAAGFGLGPTSPPTRVPSSLPARRRIRPIASPRVSAFARSPRRRRTRALRDGRDGLIVGSRPGRRSARRARSTDGPRITSGSPPPSGGSAEGYRAVSAGLELAGLHHRLQASEVGSDRAPEDRHDRRHRRSLPPRASERPGPDDARRVTLGRERCRGLECGSGHAPQGPAATGIERDDLGDVRHPPAQPLRHRLASGADAVGRWRQPAFGDRVRRPARGQRRIRQDGEHLVHRPGDR